MATGPVRAWPLLACTLIKTRLALVTAPDDLTISFYRLYGRTGMSSSIIARHDPSVQRQVRKRAPLRTLYLLQAYLPGSSHSSPRTPLRAPLADSFAGLGSRVQACTKVQTCPARR